jgi:hypothetical protein
MSDNSCLSREPLRGFFRSFHALSAIQKISILDILNNALRYIYPPNFCRDGAVGIFRILFLNNAICGGSQVEPRTRGDLVVNIRYCERISTEYPVIFAGEFYVGEGTVLNVSVPGCEIRSKKQVEPGAYLEMTILVPDNHSSLRVGLAKVRWCNGQRFGVEFIRMLGEDQVRLGRLVKQYGSSQSATRLRPAQMLHS